MPTPAQISRILDRRRDREDNVISAIYDRPAPGGTHYVTMRDGSRVEAAGTTVYQSGTDVLLAKSSTPGAPPVVLPSIPLGRSASAAYQRAVEQPGVPFPPAEEGGGGAPVTYWAYYIDPAAGTEGRVYVYSLDAAGSPVAAVDQVDVPVRPGFSTYGFTRASLLQYSCPNPDGRLTLWDPSQTAGKTWMWTPGGTLQNIDWVNEGFGGYPMTLPILYSDGLWYWAQQVGSLSTQVQLYRTASSFTAPDEVGSVQGPPVGEIGGPTIIAADDGPPALCTWSSIHTVVYLRYLDGSGGDDAVPLLSDDAIKRGGVYDEVEAAETGTLGSVAPLDGDTAYVRIVKENFTVQANPWPSASPWERIGSGAVAVQPLPAYGGYLAMEQTATGMRLLLGPHSPTGDPDLDVTLGAHPDHPGIYPALVMAVG